MNKQDLIRYEELTKQRTEILLRSGSGWRPEYGAELEQIEQELAAIRVRADEGQQDHSKIPVMLPIAQAAEATGLSREHLRNLCLQNKIVFITAGSKRLINMDRLTDFLNGEVIA